MPLEAAEPLHVERLGEPWLSAEHRVEHGRGAADLLGDASHRQRARAFRDEQAAGGVQ
jgi:hypothetical protein